MSVAECGGEPQNQKWAMDNKGHISNTATNSCLDVQSCQTWISYQACNKTSSCALDGTCSGNFFLRLLQCCLIMQQQ